MSVLDVGHPRTLRSGHCVDDTRRVQSTHQPRMSPTYPTFNLPGVGSHVAEEQDQNPREIGRHTGPLYALLKCE